MGTALLVIQMHPPHRHPILLLLNRCKTLKHLRCIHAKLTILGPAFLHPSPTFTKLLYTFTFLHPLPPTHSIDYALSLFHRIPSPSTFAYNLLIRARTLLSSPFQALILFARMRRLSIPPDYHSFPFALKACARLRSLPLGRALHSQALKLGFATDLFVHNTLISMYASSDSMLDARSLFDEISSCDVVTYNTLIDGYVKAGDMILARKLFDEMPHRDTVSWGTLLAGYSQIRQFKEALQLFDQMLPTGSRPDDVALVSALSCCAQLGALDQGKVIHQYIKENRAALNVYLLTGLVDMYAKCGCIDAATEMFDSTTHRNLFTWNAIVVGLAMHGHGERSLRYFERMIGVGVRPDGVSFLGVLVACSHAGLTDTARKLFDEMESIFGVARELKHYGCMADLLGRAGLMEKAMDMIKAMPMEADAYVWGGVLGGCRIHGNVEIAEIATEHLLRLNPEDSGVYSIMAGIYANARRWEDVARMRRLMEDRRVRKNVGRSLIEVEGGLLLI
uniref:Pentatricopeptide repeat-containing protein At5g61800 n=1 Tax=Elaeis guineensis var. tenera TaxID=51953 RepID=A0A6I9SF53_ELAGV|nr:pentatricopeptide repeat-containing protein At5g61800 [Elaeis guineensis]